MSVLTERPARAWRTAALPGLVESRSAWTHASLAVFCALLMFGPLAFGAVEDWALLVMRLGGALLGMCWVVAQVVDRRCRFRLQPALHVPLAVFSCVILLQLTVAFSAYHEKTAQSAANYLVYAIAFLAASTLATDSEMSVRLQVVLGSFGFLYALSAMTLHLSSPGELFWRRMPEAGGMIFGAYVNRNHYAGFIELLWPLPAVAALRKDVDVQKRLMFGFCALFMAATVFACGSRSGMLAVAAQCAVLLFISKRNLQGRKLWAYAFVVLIALIAWLGGASVADRLSTLAQAQGTSGVRRRIFEDAIRMVAQKPLLGWGLGSFPVAYPQFRSFFTNQFVNQAHNDYLQILVETGFLGFCAVLALIAGALRKAVAELDIWLEDDFANLSVGAMLGVIGLLAHSFTDFNFQIPANALLLFALCGIAARTRRDEIA